MDSWIDRYKGLFFAIIILITALFNFLTWKVFSTFDEDVMLFCPNCMAKAILIDCDNSPFFATQAIKQLDKIRTLYTYQLGPLPPNACSVEKINSLKYKTPSVRIPTPTITYLFYFTPSATADYVLCPADKTYYLYPLGEN